MFKLIYERLTSKRGFVKVEENFTPGEHRTVVEIARDKLADTATFRNVRVLDYRLVKGEVVTIRPVDPDAGQHAPVELSRVAAKVPALTWLDLGKLPRKPVAKKPAKAKTVKLLGVPVANLDAFDAPKKPARVSKRARQYGATEKAVS